MNIEEAQKLINDILTVTQKDEVDRAVADVQNGALSLLALVENLRPKLTAREADLRANGVNELCAILLHLECTAATENPIHYIIDSKDCNFLLDYLLARVEDSGHLADLLITAIHHLLITYYGGGLNGRGKSLESGQLDRALTVLFENNGVQSYGQRDRHLLFAMFEHLLDTHCAQLRQLGPQRTVMAFLHSAQGEREPRVLLSVFRLHQKVASLLKLGVLVEDMFEVVACYFPIDYEPDDADAIQIGPVITREMLGHGLHSCLLANPAFGPFCTQMVVEKLMETDAEMGADSDAAMVARQLEVCEFFLVLCQRHTADATNENANDEEESFCTGLEQDLDNLMTGFRLIFMNPGQSAALLERSTGTVGQAVRALATALMAGNSEQQQHVLRLMRRMAETTLENIEPFVLQAEMGTMGKAFRLLQCVAESSPAALETIVPRALYWLNVLIGGQTLRSPQNRAEIAMEALEWLPRWLRLCLGLAANGPKPTFEQETAVQLVESTIVPLLEQLLELEGICTEHALADARSRALSVLLLPICTKSSASEKGAENEDECAQMFAAILRRNQRFRELCTQHCRAIMALGIDVFQGEKEQEKLNALKQFVALFCAARLLVGGDVPNEQLDNDQQPQKQVHWLLPATFCPLPSELEGRTMKPAVAESPGPKTLLAAQKLVSRALARHFAADEIAGKDSSSNEEKKFADNQQSRHLVVLVELVQRLANNNSHGEGLKDKSVLEAVLERLGQEIAEHQARKQWNGKKAQLDLLAETLQAIGGTLLRAGKTAEHAQLYERALTSISISILCADDGEEKPEENLLLEQLRPFRIWFLLLLQSERPEPVLAITRALLSLANKICWDWDGDHDGNFEEGKLQKQQKTAKIEAAEWLFDALCQLHFALFNRRHCWTDNDKNDALVSTLANIFTAISVATAVGKRQRRKLMNEEYHPIANLHSAAKAVATAAVHFRLRVLEQRSLLLTSPSADNKMTSSHRLRQLLEECFSALATTDDDYDHLDAELQAQFLADDLLDFDRPATDPEKCFYGHTMFWRQRIFCQFVPIYLDCLEGTTTKENSSKQPRSRMHMLALVQPLLRLVSQIPVDSLLNELTKLAPLIGESLPLALLSPSADARGGDYAAATALDCNSLLDGLRLLLNKLPSSASLDPAMLRQIVRCLCDSVLMEQQNGQQQKKKPITLQLKIFDCLALVAQRGGASAAPASKTTVRREQLAPLYGQMVRACTAMASSRKRLVRQRAAAARNAWELMLA